MKDPVENTISTEPINGFLVSTEMETTLSPRLTGIEDFLAVSPIPADVPTKSAEDHEAHDMASPPRVAPRPSPAIADDEVAANRSRIIAAEAIAADLPILSGLPIEVQSVEATPASPAIADEAATLAAAEPSALVGPTDLVVESVGRLVDAGAENDHGREGGRGGDSLLAVSLDEGLLADPATLLSAGPTVLPSRESAVDAPVSRFDPWASDSSWPSPSTGRSSAHREDVSDFAETSGSWSGRGDDTSSTETLERIEGRLSQAVEKLEQAAERLASSSPAPMGARPRGFRGRIDG